MAVDPSVKDVLNHKKELFTALAVLAMFWSAAGLCYFLGWAGGAVGVAVLGTLAASERFFRVVANSPSFVVRIATSCVWVAVISATVWALWRVRFPHGLP